MDQVSILERQPVTIKMADEPISKYQNQKSLPLGFTATQPTHHTCFIQTLKSASETIQWTLYALTSLIQNIGIDHRRRDILVPEQFLNRHDIGARFQQLRR